MKRRGDRYIERRRKRKRRRVRVGRRGGARGTRMGGVTTAIAPLRGEESSLLLLSKSK